MVDDDPKGEQTKSANNARPCDNKSASGCDCRNAVKNKFWRGGRVAEGAPLLREYRLIPIEGSNPSLSAILIKKLPIRAAFLLIIGRAGILDYKEGFDK